MDLRLAPKVVEEAGELQQVLGKLLALKKPNKNHRKKLIEEVGDLYAAIDLLVEDQHERLFRHEVGIRRIASRKRWRPKR